MMRRILLAAVFIAAFLPASRPRAAPDPAAEVPLANAGTRLREFVLEAGQTRVELGRSFIVPGSDSVSLDGAALARGEDYRINALRGSIVLVRPAAGGERLTVRFAHWPLPFSPVFAAHIAEPAAGEGAGDIALPVRRRIESRPTGESYRLRLAGSKSVGVSVGSNRDLGLDQSLKVSMVGTIAKDLEVNAFLTDDDLPVQPAGNTEELKQLDRVLIQVKSRHSDVRLGDFSSGLSWFRFSRFKRDLRGVAADVGAAGQSFVAGGGIARGRFRTVRFVGREGVQGPYELLPAQRFNSVTILAGTEIVFFDGRLLRRGAENDYVIDYSRGAVTFTERVPVTDDSEIVIDFEVSEFGYDRSTLYAGWSSPAWGSAVTVRTSFFQEGDDRAGPLAGPLSAEDQAVLAAAGNDPEKAVTSGIERVEAGEGDYLLVGTAPDSTYFVFVESGGEYRLEFIDVGPGNGDYATDGFSAKGYVKYRWVGAGGGGFRVGRRLALPERKRIFSLGAAAEAGAVFIEGEGNISDYDRNLFSPLDDGENGGLALRFEGGLKDYAVPAGTVSLQGEFSRIDERFSAPDKMRETYFYRDWGLENEPLSGTETIAGARAGITGERAWNAAGGYQRLWRGPSLTAHKTELAGELGNLATRGLALRGMSSRAGDDRERRFAHGTGVLAFWHLVPRLDVEAERYAVRSTASPDTGRAYRQGTAALAGRDLGPFRAMLSYTKRTTDLLDTLRGAWEEARENDEASFDGGYASGARVVELLATHRRSRARPGGGESTYNLARLRARDSWERPGVAADVSYRIGGGEERTLQKSVIFVGEKQGDYDAAGREVGQKRGDYMLVYIPGAERVRVNAVELSMQASFGAGVRGIGGEGAAEGSWSAIKRNVSLDHFFSVIEKSTTDDLAGLFLMRPSLLQRDDVTVYGATKLREELTLFGSSRVFKLRLAYTREDEEDNRTEGAAAESFGRELRLRAETAAWRTVAVTWEARTGLSLRRTAVAAAQRYEIETIGGSQTIVYRLGPSTKISFEIGAEKRSDAVTLARQVSYIATPSFSTSLGTRFNAAALLRVTYTNAESPAGKPLFFLEDGFREDWNLLAQYRVSRNISFGLNYTGRREKDYRGEVGTVNDLKIESRAYF